MSYNRFITSLGRQNKVSYITQLHFVMYDDINNSASLRDVYIHHEAMITQVMYDVHVHHT